MSLCSTFQKFKTSIIPLILAGCVSTGNGRLGPDISIISLSEISNNTIAGTFARLCLSQNRSIAGLVHDARSTGWNDANDEQLQSSGLGTLRRTILEIPGGGGRYRETQSILVSASISGNLIANIMERFERHDRLVRTECTLYAGQQDLGPICTAVGKMVNRPPDSNQKFPRSNSQFIRWNVIDNGRQAKIRCDGIGIDESPAAPSGTFAGTVISLVVDYSNVVNIRAKGPE